MRILTGIDNSTVVYEKLADLLVAVYEIQKSREYEKADDHDNTEERTVACQRRIVLLDLLRKQHYWPSIQMKRIAHQPDLVLLFHKYQNQKPDTPVTGLYKECKSIILNLNADKIEDCIVISMMNESPIPVSDTDYETNMELYTGGTFEAGYEGTMINVYYYNGIWNFSTSTCPNIDESKYAHPTKTHGMMFDDFLQKIFPNVNPTSDNLRQEFTSKLDTSKSYIFVIVHHENRRLIDYTELFGENYTELLHISTQSHGIENDISSQPLKEMGVKYAETFETKEEALSWLKNNTTSYAIIVKQTDKDKNMLKICRKDTNFREFIDLGNSNPWYNMLWIFLQNRKDYNIYQYIKEKKIRSVCTDDGTILQPVDIFQVVLSALTCYLYESYRYTTTYSIKTFNLYFDSKVDKIFAPIIRFHLVQLRNIQKEQIPDKYITPRIISDYLRYHQNMRNIRLLIKYFSDNPSVNMTLMEQLCFKTLNNLLMYKDNTV